MPDETAAARERVDAATDEAFRLAMDKQITDVLDELMPWRRFRTPMGCEFDARWSPDGQLPDGGAWELRAGGYLQAEEAADWSEVP